MPPIPITANSSDHGSSSAADFLRSISAESSVSFGAPVAAAAIDSASTKTAPELPISAKVSLIDAQIDNLEAQIQSTIQTHAEQLKQRALASRDVDNGLNELWQSINQTSSRLVGVPIGVVPFAVQYHDALEQSQTQALLVSVLSEILPVLKLLEQLESMLEQRDLEAIQAQLPQAETALHTITSQPALQNLSAVAELQRRFQVIKDRHISLSNTTTEPPDTQKSVEKAELVPKPVSSSASTPSNIFSILDTARKLIISKGAENGWKAVVVTSPHEVAVPVVPQLPEEPVPPEAHPVTPMREGLIRPASPLTRSSSNSSGVNSRRQKAKLGARVLRPQDQLGSGPFNAQDAGVDGSDWGLDDDDDDVPVQTTGPSSVAMHSTSSNSSLQRAALAMQHEDDGDEAWGLEEEPTKSDPPQSTSLNSTSAYESGSIKSPRVLDDEAGAWGLNDDDDIIAPTLSTTESNSNSIPQVSRNSSSPSPAPSFTSAVQNLGDGEDAWNIEDDDDDDDVPQDVIANLDTAPELATPLVSQHNRGDVWGSEPKATPALQQCSAVPMPETRTDHDEDLWNPADESSAAIEASRPLPKDQVASATAQEEVCTISQRSIDLVQLVRQTMDEGIRLLSLKDADAAGASKPDLVLATVGEIFELHRSLMPVAHGEVLRDVPSLAMQFFNDCEYLARELMELINSKNDTISAAWAQSDPTAAAEWQSTGLAKLQQQALLTRSLGQRWFEAQITAQSKVLLDTLIEADGFARTFDEERFTRCERCIKQVVHTLEQLGNAWRSILAPSHFDPALGRLVDLVFQKVLHDVLDLEDIGESESEKIGGLIKRLGGLESLFTDAKTQQSSAPLFVPSWFKTSYLIEILTGSLVDIEFLAFEARALVDYSRKELTGLIKALFSDTNNRSKLLHKIEMAAPDILAR